MHYIELKLHSYAIVSDEVDERTDRCSEGNRLEGRRGDNLNWDFQFGLCLVAFLAVVYFRRAQHRLFES